MDVVEEKELINVGKQLPPVALIRHSRKMQPTHYIFLPLLRKVHQSWNLQNPLPSVHIGGADISSGISMCIMYGNAL